MRGMTPIPFMWVWFLGAVSMVWFLRGADRRVTRFP